jgi:hypothetical protein
MILGNPVILTDPTGLQTITLGNYALLKGDASGGGFFNNLYRIGEYGGDNIDISGTTTDQFSIIIITEVLKITGAPMSYGMQAISQLLGATG